MSPAAVNLQVVVDGVAQLTQHFRSSGSRCQRRKSASMRLTPCSFREPALSGSGATNSGRGQRGS
jgi:hypothetical protein